MRDGLGAVKGGRGSFDQGTDGRRMDRGRPALGGHRQASIDVRKVVKTVLDRVKTVIGPSQGEAESTW